MSIMCRAVQIALPTVGETGVTGLLSSHVDTCIACSVEVLRYRSMYRELGELEASTHRAPGSFTDTVLASLGPVAVDYEEAQRDNRVPVAAAAVVATAAAGTAVLLRMYRQRAA